MIIELPAEIEMRLSVEAARRGQQPTELVTQLLERELMPKEFDLESLLALPRSEQEQVMTDAFDDAASLYNADLALPVSERELTAFTSLDRDELAEYE
jgi:hypothetical protein